MEQSAFRMDVVIGHADLFEPRVIVAETLPLSDLVDEPLLDRPVDVLVDQRVILGLHCTDSALPQFQDALDVRMVRPAVLHEAPCPLQQTGLDLDRRHLLPRAGPDRGGPAQVMADVADGADRILQLVVPDRHTGFDHAQHQVRGPIAQQRRRLRHVGITDDDVQPAVQSRIGMGLVAGVDDGPGSGRRRGNTLPHVIGALGEREMGVLGVVGRDHMTGTRQDLPRDQERQQDPGEPAEVGRPGDEVVLMRPEGIALRIHVVLQQVYLA